MKMKTSSKISLGITNLCRVNEMPSYLARLRFHLVVVSPSGLGAGETDAAFTEAPLRQSLEEVVSLAVHFCSGLGFGNHLICPKNRQEHQLGEMAGGLVRSSH